MVLNFIKQLTSEKKIKLWFELDMALQSLEFYMEVVQCIHICPKKCFVWGKFQNRGHSIKVMWALKTASWSEAVSSIHFSSQCQDVRWVKKEGLEGSNLKTDATSGHLFFANNPISMWKNNSKYQTRVPVNMKLLTGTWSLSIRNYWQGPGPC